MPTGSPGCDAAHVPGACCLHFFVVRHCIPPWSLCECDCQCGDQCDRGGVSLQAGTLADFTLASSGIKRVCFLAPRSVAVSVEDCCFMVLLVLYAAGHYANSLCLPRPSGSRKNGIFTEHRLVSPCHCSLLDYA